MTNIGYLNEPMTSAYQQTPFLVSHVIVPLQVEVQVKRKGPISSNLCCHLWALHFSEALLWDPQQLLRRTRESLKEGGKGGAAVMVTVPAGGIHQGCTCVQGCIN